MRKLFFVIIIFFSTKICPIFCEARSSITFITGTGTDSALVEKNTVSLEWIYNYSSDFLNLTGGSQFTSSSADFTFDGKIFKSFLDESFISPEISGGMIFHSCFLNNEAFLQDSFLTVTASINFNPIFTNLGIFGGIGFNNTYIYAQKNGSWINEFFPIIEIFLSTKIRDIVFLEISLSTFTMFNYDYWSHKLNLSSDFMFSEKISFVGGLTLRYSPNPANENIQLEGMDFKIGIKYAF